MPIPYGQCPACRADERHAWTEVDGYRTDRVALRRFICDCDQCYGRCGVRLVRVDTPYDWRGRHHWQ